MSLRGDAPLSYETLAVEVEDGLLTLTLNRPDRLNAVNAAMIGEYLEALDAADRDDEVRAVIVTGAGRGFCAGADLSGGPGTFDRAPPEPGARHRDGGGLVALRLFDMKKPVIAAVNGPAVGFGATQILPMDIRLASTEARFGFVFSRRGVVMEAASSWFLPRLVGMQRAMEWVATGRVFPAQEALEGGLVRSLHAPDELLPAARALGRQIADNASPMSVALCRQMMWKMLGEDHPMAAHRIDSLGMAYTGASADAREGVASFLEKRPPAFSSTPGRAMPAFYPWWDEPRFG
ncbi:MAG: crotonase/enoyl-CoA hydratase family protein [Alphaproteobacteria bacterium]|nr:crotonase/enoyl-CoA hydratase family protein [Alphaproteobacteria bacterium]